MKILLTGARGQLGRCLQDRYPDAVHLLTPDRQELDMSQPASIAHYVRQAQPDWIINAAAYTAVDRAESEPDTALAVNATAPAVLARVASEIAARLVHVSTDYVFDGSAARPYGEGDPTKPLNVYGATKLQGEQAVLDAMPDACVIRTSWVYSEYGNNFLKTMLRLAEPYQSRDHAPSTPIRVVDDQRGCPTYAGDLADVILAIHAMSQPVSGLYHYSGATMLTWFDFAKHILECKHSMDAGFVVPPLEAIPTSEYPTPAARPASSVLSCQKIAALGVAPRTLDETLAKVVGRVSAT